MRRSRTGRGRGAGWVGALAAVLALGGAAAPAAAADVPASGLWWYDALGVPDALAKGADGHGVKIAVIDGQINPDLPLLQGADLTVHEPSFCATVQGGDEFAAAAASELNDSSDHGTNVTALIIGTGKGLPGQSVAVSGIAPKASVTFYGIGWGDLVPDRVVPDSKAWNCPMPRAPKVDEMARALMRAVDDGARIVTVSSGWTPTEEWKQAAAWAHHQGVILLLSMPNDFKHDVAAANGDIAVLPIGPDLKGATGPVGIIDGVTVLAPGGQMLLQGNRASKSWNDYELSPGSSLATPLVAGMLADVMSAYPHASSNQVVQSLVRNTGGQDHEPVYDPLMGYGYASLAHMLREDPTQYPDVNPLVVAGDKGGVTPEMIAAATRPSWADSGDFASPTPSASGSGSTPSPSGSGSTPSAVPRPEPSGTATWVWVAIGGGVVVLVLVAVGVAVAVSRRSRRPGVGAVAGPAAPPAPGGRPR